MGMAASWVGASEQSASGVAVPAGLGSGSRTGAGSAVDAGALAALCALARLHQIAADPEALRHQLGLAPGEQLTVDDLLRAARLAGLKAKRVRTRIDRVALTPLPALALLHGDPDAGVAHLLKVEVLAQCDGRRVLLMAPPAPEAASATAGAKTAAAASDGVPRIEPIEVFASHWSGELILVSSRASLAGELARFDFSWFMPALVKYRHLLGEVLLVSLVLQLLGLVSPLFFQVVMDKVLVHKAMGTLDVLVLGLLVVIVFESVLTSLRSYVLRRGNGNDSIYDFETTAGVVDRAVFEGDITADQLWFRRVGSNLEVRVIGTADQLNISGWYSSSAYRIEQFVTGSGQILLESQVQSLVDAMASFAPPAMGQVQLTPAYANVLNPTLAANWH